MEHSVPQFTTIYSNLYFYFPSCFPSYIFLIYFFNFDADLQTLKMLLLFVSYHLFDITVRVVLMRVSVLLLY